MACTIGTATDFVDFLDKLIDFVAGNKYAENVGTGNGLAQIFSFNLSNVPIAKGQCRLEFIIDGTNYEVYDDGEGSWDYHEKISASVLNYTTGAATATIQADNATSVDCTYCVGKNSGEEGRDWLVFLNQKTTDDTGNIIWPDENLKEVIFKNSGVTYKENIFVGLRQFKYPTAAIWNCNLNVMSQYIDGDSWNSNKGLHGRDAYNNTCENYFEMPSIALNDSAMAYWIVSSKNRIAGAIRVAGAIWETFYIGLGLRFSAPADYLNPLIALGSIVGNRSYQDTSSFHKYIIAPKVSGYAYMTITTENLYRFTGNISLIPMHDFEDTGEVVETTSTETPVFPVYVFDNQNEYLLFELEGVVALLRQGLQSEDIITIGADSYLVVQDVFRTEYHSYMGLLLK